MDYNSQFTGAQIDEAIADVRSNKDAWDGKQDVILASGAAVGDLIKVKAVDASGKPTAWAVAVAGTDYLTKAPVTSVNGATGEVKGTFYVMVTQGDGNSATADKTAEEVYAAYAAGYAVYANVKFRNASNSSLLPLTLVLNDPNLVDGGLVLVFGALESNDPTSEVVYASVLCHGNFWGAWYGELARSEDIPEIPTALKNPNALYIKSGKTTTRYDGSATETVEIPEGVPAVTIADNGKFLRVVSGAWAAAEIANANGGSF